MLYNNVADFYNTLQYNTETVFCNRAFKMSSWAQTVYKHIKLS